MRTATAGELTVLAGLNRSYEKRVKVANGTGTMIDLSSWVESIAIDPDIDQPVSGATVQFTRANGVLQTLAPLRTDSTLNVKDDLTYAPQLDVVRAITIEIATTALGVLPGTADYKLLFKGTASVTESSSATVVVTCRDEGAELVDRWVETPKLYGSAGGVAVQDVMEDIHDDVFGAGVVPIYTPVSPGYLIAPAYQQQIQSVMDADVALAQNPGWDFRSRWDNGTSTFRFTFAAPDRAKVTPDYTFGPSAYYDVAKLEIAETDIRNAIIVSYRNSAAQGNRTTLIRTDGPSITKYRRRPFLITEGDTSPINTTAEATTLGDSALADLKDPKADVEIVLPFFWPLDLGDLLRFSANGVHFNTDQDWAVVSYTHDLSPGRHETRVRVRGKPAGQYLTWLARGQTMGGGGAAGNTALPPIPSIDFTDGETDDTIWNVRFDALYGSGGGGTNLTYTVTVKRSSDAVATLASGNASALPDDIAIARDVKYDKVVTFTLTDAATGLIGQDSFTMAAQSIPFSPTTGLIVTAGLTDAAVTPPKSQSRFRCKAIRTATQSIADSTPTTINFNAADLWDVGSLHDTATNNDRIVIPTGGDTGVWDLDGVARWDANATGRRETRIWHMPVGGGVGSISAEDVRAGLNDGGVGPTIPIHATAQPPAVGDFFTLEVFQNSGGALNITLALFSATHSW